ncbi:MAG: phosphoadenosine phosphosulfate reductase family protein [Bilophila wadsworthia]
MPLKPPIKTGTSPETATWRFWRNARAREEITMKQTSNVVSLSGGKDSTAMLLMLLERGESVADVMFFDTGWEFPEMYEHLEKLETFTGLKITRLRPRLPVDVETDKSPFDWMFSEYPVVRRETRQVHMVGRGWPNAPVRWCTGRKRCSESPPAGTHTSERP